MGLWPWLMTKCNEGGKETSSRRPTRYKGGGESAVFLGKKEKIGVKRPPLVKRNFHFYYYGRGFYMICCDEGEAAWKATLARCARADSTHAAMLTWLSRSYLRKGWSCQIRSEKQGHQTKISKQNSPTIVCNSPSYPDPSSNTNPPNPSLPRYTDGLAILVDLH